MSFEREYYEQAELWERDFLGMPAEQERILETIALIPAKVSTILDVGCGNGFFLDSLPNGYDAVGLDFSREALKHVRTQVVHADIAALPFNAESFDLVTCLEVLEHLPWGVFEKALSEIQRVSGKYILLSVPNAEELNYSLVICPKCQCWYNVSRHVRSFDYQKLKTLFKQFALYKVKEIGPVVDRTRYNQVLYTAYRLWKGASPPSTAVCPQCGYQTTDDQTLTTSKEMGGLFVKLLKSLAKAIWPPQKYRPWLLALYAKK